jgi:hypothetical protein
VGLKISYLLKKFALNKTKIHSEPRIVVASSFLKHRLLNHFPFIFSKKGQSFFKVTGYKMF